MRAAKSTKLSSTPESAISVEPFAAGTVHTRSRRARPLASGDSAVPAFRRIGRQYLGTAH